MASAGAVARRWLVLALLVSCSLAAGVALVVYGNGATWERELPACASEQSACSLVHRRYWQSPLEIRLCRCPRKEPCPEGFEGTPNGTAVNLTARTQLKMCTPLRAPQCNASQVSLVTKIIRKIVPEAQNAEKIHAEVLCRCSRQDSDVYYRRAHGNNTADLTYYEQRQYFTCESRPSDASQSARDGVILHPVMTVSRGSTSATSHRRPWNIFRVRSMTSGSTAA
ncbi:uncharacterized protein LOC144155482 isoform X2 [Haemaphysalis longicornis]